MIFHRHYLADICGNRVSVHLMFAWQILCKTALWGKRKAEVIIEHPDSWAKSLVDEGVIAKFIPIDMSQEPTKDFLGSQQWYLPGHAALARQN